MVCAVNISAQESTEVGSPPLLLHLVSCTVFAPCTYVRNYSTANAR